jgi:hypothetical protein
MFGNYKSRMNSRSCLALYSKAPEGGESWCESTFIYEEGCLFVLYVLLRSPKPHAGDIEFFSSFVIGISMKLHKKWFWKEKLVG